MAYLSTANSLRKVSHVILTRGAGGNQDNLNLTYDTETLPALQNFEGENAQGTWRLKVADLANRDEGKLNKWGLEIQL